MGNRNFPPAMGPEDVEKRVGTVYPDGLKGITEGRIKQKLGNALGLSQFGVNLVTLKPGGGSSQRHWHETEDEFIYIVQGTATLITDEGEQELTAGMFAGFPAGVPDGHNLVNKGVMDVVYLEVGTRTLNDKVTYPDVDMKLEMVDGNYRFLHKDGTPYPEG
ncbi:cupin domain-containing protein [Aestuariispira insulae]|uniref:Putative cupin superfamily protein n=1 Tax=Aestuariispira insulae TaxID=1461337 RepID=A0A3D9HGJ8_9PROT|nr:cupin domain-containing protein [Aestuariispira insulae]RED48607.1 putative cupin superfamily protein [Aestuariispira insulae]